MQPNPKENTRMESERQVLRFLCAGGADAAAQQNVARRLADYSWRDADHEILFEAIGELLAREPRRILRELPAAITRRGFPDIACEWLAEDSAMDSTDAMELTEKLLRAS
ncbi:MAG TPA: hypothetical protein VGR81_02025 [Candidatus Acidoferrales bacterium]|nr:hypothetical protein [Candidatus Acidoferrales bacterium]